MKAKGYVIVPNPTEVAQMLYDSAMRQYPEDTLRQPTLAPLNSEAWVVSYMSEDGQRVYLTVHRT